MSSVKQERLLDALHENSLVKAALLIDHDGRVKDQRGQARVVRVSAGRQAESSQASENVYMLELSQNMLAVVFDDSVEFERLRRAVDMLVEHAGLAKKG